MTSNQRPLSPHLGLYRWQLHMALSILHRATGVFLTLGILYVSGWVLAVSSGPDAATRYSDFAWSIPGRMLLFAFSYALIFHLMNGIRHLVWDSGRGLRVKTVKRSGLLVTALSILITLGVWAAGYAAAGRF